MNTFTIITDGTTDDVTYMVEGCNPHEIEKMGTETYVREFVKTAINATNYGDASDVTIYRNWRKDTDEFQMAVNWINQWIADNVEYGEAVLPIPAAYNAGEWRLSKLVYGPRGGKQWKRMTYGIAATGGSYITQLEIGTTYKTTYWVNGWAHSGEFIFAQ